MNNIKKVVIAGKEYPVSEKGNFSLSGSCEKQISFPSVLKSERNRLGWTRTKMAEITGIPYGTLESWERGVEPAAYIKKYVLADLREKGSSASKFFDMVDVLNEIDEYLNGPGVGNYIGENSILHKKITAVIYE